MNLTELICKLSDYISVSGNEDHNFLKSILTAELGIDESRISVDRSRNLIVTVGEGEKHIMIDAHFDEIGFIVTHVGDDGFIRIANVGGTYTGALFGAKLEILSEIPCKGIVVTTPPHLQKEKADSLPEITDFWVDTGLKNAKERIKPGDIAIKYKKAVALSQNRISGKALDNRAGTAVLLRVLDLIKDKTLKHKLSFVFSAQEEVGTRGAGSAAFSLKPDEAIVIDVSFANQRGVKKEQSGVIGGGPMLGISPILNRDMFNRFKAICDADGIPYNVEVMSGRTGTNSDPVTVTGEGIKTGLISIPLRNMHTSSEVIDIRDIENSAKLIALYIEE